MAQIRAKNTKPEILIRSLLHRLGFRFRLHRKNLPGKPDIVLSKYKTVIEVRGCYWHRHQGCKEATLPKSNTAFWEKKFSETVNRDKKNVELLTNLGWEILIVWECETKNIDQLTETLIRKIKI